MIGAIAGDIIGSAYDGFYGRTIKTKKFKLFADKCCFTDDSILTVAIADALMNGNNFSEKIVEYATKYPGRGYGGNFDKWVKAGGGEPYGSWGNGSAMRVSPVVLVSKDIDECMTLAKQTAEVSHNHPEGIKGAQAVAACAFLAKDGKTLDEIKQFVEENFYPMDFMVDDIRPTYKWDVSCQGSVPQAIKCFLESTDFEDAIRTVVSLGGDADTQGAMVGAIAEAYYGIPNDIVSETYDRLDDHLKEVVKKFYEFVD